MNYVFTGYDLIVQTIWKTTTYRIDTKKAHTQHHLKCLFYCFECETLLGVFIEMICLAIFKWFSQ